MRGGTLFASRRVAVTEVDAAGYGVVADDSADNAAAVLAAINGTPTGATLVMPRGGTMRMSQTVVVERGDITIDMNGSAFAWTDTALATAGRSQFLVFKGTDTNTRISNVTVKNGTLSVPQWSDGTNRLTTGTAPSQAGLAAGEFKLPSTGSSSASFYDSAILFVLEGTGEGQIRNITGYNASSKVLSSTDYTTGLAAWNVQPDETSEFAILLAGGTYAQTTYGVGGIAFFFCDDIYIENLRIEGGHAGLHFGTCENVFLVGVDSENVIESTIDMRSGCEGFTVVGGRWNSGEGLDCGEGDIILLGVHYTAVGDNDSFVDIDDVSAGPVLMEGCISYGAASAISIHGATASNDIHIKSCHFNGFRDAGISFVGDTVDYSRAFVTGCTIKSDREDGNLAAAGIKLGATSAGNTDWLETHISQCHIDVPGYAITINRADYLTIADCFLKSSQNATVRCIPAASHPINDLTIKGCDIWGSWVATRLLRYSVSLGSPSAGTFTLTHSGNTTAGIAYNANAAAVQAALEALASIGAGNVAVYGTPGGVFYVRFIGALAANTSALTGSGAGLTGGTFALSLQGHDTTTHGAIHFASNISRLTIEDNRVHSSGGIAIKADTITSVTVRGNQVFGDGADTNGSAIHLTTCTNAVVENNIIHNSSSYGFRLINNVGLTFRNNTTWMTGRHALYIQLTSTTPIKSNRLNWQFIGNQFNNWSGPSNAGAPTTNSMYAILFNASAAVALSADLKGIVIADNQFAAPAYTSSLTNVNGIILQNQTTGGFTIHVKGMHTNEGQDTINEFIALTGAFQLLDMEANTSGTRTLSALEAGQSFSNEGAAAAVTYALPPATVGLGPYDFYVRAAQELRIDPNGSETLNLTVGGAQQAAGAYAVSSTVGGYRRYKCVKTGEWEVMEAVGTFTAV